MALRFHWSLSQAGDPWRKTQALRRQSGLLDLEEQIELCRVAERNGIETMLMAFSYTRPDPLILATAIGKATEKIAFLVACRSGVFSPTFFAQQVNTVSALTGGRIAINIVAGHSPKELAYYGDFLDHDERYGRTEEFLDVCSSLWRGEGPVDYDGQYYRIVGGRLKTPFVSPRGSAPEIFLGGNSRSAEELAIRHADCLFRYPESPEPLRPKARRLVERGTAVGLRVAVLARSSREEALRAAKELQGIAAERAGESRRTFVRQTDSVAFRSTLDLAESADWPSPYLWTGVVPYLGEACLVGSAEDVATALVEYRDVGVSHFLLSGWPDRRELEFFGAEILPRVRRLEGAAGA